LKKKKKVFKGDTRETKIFLNHIKSLNSEFKSQHRNFLKYKSLKYYYF